MISIPVLLSLFFAFLTFGLTGFGSGLVAMSLLTPIIGVETAAPFFALLSITAEVLMFLRYRHAISLRAVWRLALGSLVAIPIGLTLVRDLDEKFVLVALGFVVAGYALYSLLAPKLPQLANGERWAWGFGFLSGLLTGAYNTGGPPLIIYANLSRWGREEYKSNLPGIFMLNSAVVISSHLLAGHYTSTIVQGVAISLPVMLIGLIAGWRLDTRVNPEWFRKLVLVLLILIGIRLILTNLTFA